MQGRGTDARRGWARGALAVLAAALAIGGAAACWALVSHCPGSPWTCEQFGSACPAITWCQDEPGTCVWYSPNYGYKKYLIIKKCTKPGPPPVPAVLCSACGGPVQDGCCNSLEDEPECPVLGACPPV